MVKLTYTRSHTSAHARMYVCMCVGAKTSIFTFQIPNGKLKGQPLLKYEQTIFRFQYLNITKYERLCMSFARYYEVIENLIVQQN